MKPIDLQVGDVVQIDPEHDDIFGGHFMIVTEPKSWGAQGYCLGFPYEGKNGRVPAGRAFYRCKFENMELIGQAVWMQE